MRPFVFVNLAMSADGKLSTRARRQVRISGREDFARVDRIKAASDAIVVGIGTVLADNPSLTVKSPELRQMRRDMGVFENPLRIVVDSRGRTPYDADILHKGPGKRLIAVSHQAPAEKIRNLALRADVRAFGEQEVDLTALLAYLYEEGVQRVMVEGGGTLIGSLFRDGLVDEFITYIGNMVIGGKDAPTPADGEGFISEALFPKLTLTDMCPCDDGVLITWTVAHD
ncbi:MAG: 2,5-diamino-6-(ribosylamino)-4(3H)-pyrimidinone 5'-phosphate reductase [Methanomicrobiaceae archaeon]|nr:2,5-diamino-6-(ribosylamino)-4(3H)-pyrimidinone 5'-phosphate reductase [Methanomicrobiaceae archaeon]